MNATVTAVSRNDSHAFSKANAGSIRLLTGLGVEGDAHLGKTVKHRSRVARDPSQPNLRQAHLIHAELHDELHEAGFDVSEGQMGENVTTRGVDLLGLPRGIWLRLGERSVVEVTGLRNPCKQLNDFQPDLQSAVLDRDEHGGLIRKAGIMGIVVAGGRSPPWRPYPRPGTVGAARGAETCLRWNTSRRSESLGIEHLLENANSQNGLAYNYAFLDEQTKRELRRKTLKAVSIPGHQVPFGSREMPLARGWGTGGLQLSLALVGPGDVYKAIDQGADESVNAVNMRSLVARMAEVETTLDARKATIVQTRHRIPEEPLREDQILVFQVPIPEPLERVEPRISKARGMHAERDYSRMWLFLYESVAKHGEIMVGARYPVIVNRSYLMDPSPIPRWDVPKLHEAPYLSLFGAGREKRIYAIPPHTSVEPLEFDDHRFRVERFSAPCRRCGSTDTFLDETTDESTGETRYTCSDTSFCAQRREAR